MGALAGARGASGNASAPAGLLVKSNRVHASGRTSNDRALPFALIDVKLREMPKVDTGEQTFTPNMDVTLLVFIPRLREEPFEFPGHVVNGAAGTGAIFEDLELRNFPLDVQRLHAMYVFNFDDTTLGNVSQEAVFDIVLIVRRRPLFYLVNIALPVWCIMLFSFISFRFGEAELGARLQVMLTMVLTLVAFKLSVSTAKYVPITNRINLMDRFMIAAFLVVALVALQNFLTFELLSRAPW
ncbi:hypothetical protein FOA52_015509 [Chlamydomonas sp. UWO 241]|nr:hypothetical protein FOA52_015509 [Chlamydomonas sp. UWO 241]